MCPVGRSVVGLFWGPLGSLKYTKHRPAAACVVRFATQAIVRHFRAFWGLSGANCQGLIVVSVRPCPHQLSAVTLGEFLTCIMTEHPRQAVALLPDPSKGLPFLGTLWDECPLPPSHAPPLGAPLAAQRCRFAGLPVRAFPEKTGCLSRGSNPDPPRRAPEPHGVSRDGRGPGLRAPENFRLVVRRTSM